MSEAAEVFSPKASISHATHSEEFIAVLQGDDTSAEMQSLQNHATAFERSTGLKILSSHAAATGPSERLEMVFVRADEALSLLKDKAAGLYKVAA